MQVSYNSTHLCVQLGNNQQPTSCYSYLSLVGKIAGLSLLGVTGYFIGYGRAINILVSTFKLTEAALEAYFSRDQKPDWYKYFENACSAIETVKLAEAVISEFSDVNGLLLNKEMLVSEVLEDQAELISDFVSECATTSAFAPAA